VAAPRAPYGLVVLGLILCLVRPFPEAGLYGLTDLVIVLVVLPVLVMLATRSPPPARVMKLTLWLGALSYPLYAIHAPLLRGFETVLDRLSDSQEMVGWIVALPAVIALAALFERRYDAPIRSWLRARRR